MKQCRGLTTRENVGHQPFSISHNIFNLSNEEILQWNSYPGTNTFKRTGFRFNYLVNSVAGSEILKGQKKIRTLANVM